MDNKGKELAKVCFVGVCLIVAVFLLWRYVYRRTPGGVGTIEPGQAILTLCANSSCKNQTEMDKRAYYEEVEKRLRMNPQQSLPTLVCSKCGKNSVFRAVQCPKCTHTFRYGSMQHDTADRCPKCRYSQMDVDRKKQGV